VTEEHELPLEEYHRGRERDHQRKPEVYKRLYSRRDEVTLANPFGPPSAAGARSPRRWTAPQRTTGTAKSSDSTTCPR
jgi:hypothetical protein